MINHVLEMKHNFHQGTGIVEVDIHHFWGMALMGSSDTILLHRVVESHQVDQQDKKQVIECSSWMCCNNYVWLGPSNMRLSIRENLAGKWYMLRYSFVQCN